MDASPTITIAQALFDFSGSGQGVDDMLEAIAHSQAEAVIAALHAAGFTIIHRDENHGPTRDRAAEVAQTWHLQPSMVELDIAAAIRAMEGDKP